MDIPAHRAAAVAPTPAHSFELREGDQFVNLTEEARKAAEAAPAPAEETDTHAADPAGDPVALSITAKRRKVGGDAPILTAPMADE